MGPRERGLNEYLTQINVVHQAYHSGTFVGNHCVSVLQHYSKICDFIQGSELKDKLNELFHLFSRIQPLMSANRFLSDEEVSSLCDLCETFGELYPVYLDDSIPRKVHELICTVPRFVRKHRTLGLLGEQSSESLHAAVNMEMRQLASVKNKSEKLRLTFVRQELRAAADKTMIQSVKRLCPNDHGGGWSFLRMGKHCIICSPQHFN